MPDQAPLTLGESLAAPMERANPSTFPWQATQWRLRWGRGGVTAHGLVTQLRASGDDGWQAICYGPGGLAMPAMSFETADDARAAVEEHILAHVDTGLSEEPRHEHEWVDVTKVESRHRELLCVGCGERKEEPR